MPAPKFIVIDGKPHLWRDILEKRREQLAAMPKHEQPSLFELKHDARPLTQRTAVGRYREPSLFALLDSSTDATYFSTKGRTV